MGADEILAAYIERLAPHDEVDAEALCAAHPEHAEELRRMVADWRQLLGMMQPPDGGGATPSSSIVARLRDRRARPGERYEARGEVARGGMGAILEVWDRDLLRSSAMKVVREDHARAPGARDPAASERALGRFLDEAQITGQLDHPGVVPVHELGVDADDRVYFTMRLVQGVELGEVLRLARDGEGGWSQARVLGVVAKVCEAVAYAHSKGVIHRDLKPANVMVGRFGEVYVMDWGLARVLGEEDHKDLRPRPAGAAGVRTERRSGDGPAGESPLLTMDGDVVGTPAYMSPEQARGDLSAMGPASDAYSIGAILYHLLAGHMPYVPTGARSGAYAVLARVQQGPPRPLSDFAREAPAELVSICEKAMARDPRDRYADVRELAADLSAYVEGRVVRAHRTGALVELAKWVRRNRALAASLAVAVLVALGGSAAVAIVSAGAEREARWRGYVANLAAASSSLAGGAGFDARARLAACPEEHRGWEWRYLENRADASAGRYQSPGTPGLAASSLVHAVAYDPTGEHVAAGCTPEGAIGGSEFAVKVWRAESRELAQELHGIRTVLCGLEFGPAGQALAATGRSQANPWGYEDQTIVWELGRADPLAESAVGGWDLAFVPERPGELAVATDDGLVLWDFLTGDQRFVQTFRVGDQRLPLGALRSVAVSADGARVAVGLPEAVIRVFDAESLLRAAPGGAPQQLGQFDLSHLVSHDVNVAWRGVTDLEFAGDGSALIAALGSGDAMVLALAPGARSVVLRGHRKAVTAARFAGPGIAWTAGRDGTLRRWDTAAARTLEVLHGHADFVTSLAVGPDGRCVSGSRDRTVRAWSADPGASETVLLGSKVMSFDAYATALSPDGERLAWHVDMRTVRVSDARTGRERFTLPAAREMVGALRFDATGARLHTLAEAHCVWDARTGELLEQHVRERGPTEIVVHAQLGPGAERAALVWVDAGTGIGADPGPAPCRLEIRETRSWELVRDLALDVSVSSLCFTDDGRRVFVGGFDGAVRAFELESGALERTIAVPGADGAVFVAVDRAGSTLAASRMEPLDRRLWLWDLRTDAPPRALEGRPSPTKMGFHPDGERLLAGSWEGLLSVWHLERGELVDLSGHEGPITAVEISADGTRVASADGSGLHRVWHTERPATEAP